MNYNASFFILIVLFSFSCLAQSGNRIPANPKKQNAVLMPDNLANITDYTIISYHVVEKVSGNVTIYNVSDSRLIDKNDLGPNNTRVVTPIYGKVKTKSNPKLQPNVEANNALSKDSYVVAIPTEKLIPVDNVVAAVPVKKVKFVMVDVMSTYERILEKGGYESLEMLKKVADNRYFKGELTVAYKWYSQLFALTADLEIVYYYRYAQALKSVGQINKADDMMKLFSNKIESK